MDKFEVADLYEAAYQEHGRSVHALNWSSKKVADKRLHVLLEIMEPTEHHTHEKLSILDVGCGFGDLLNYPGIASWMDSYLGIDNNSDFINIAHNRFGKLGNVNFWHADFMECNPAKKDLVIANGTLAFYNLPSIYDMVGKMWEATGKMLAFNFTRNDDVGLKEIEHLLQYVGIRRFTVRCDFGRLGEFAVYAYRD